MDLLFLVDRFNMEVPGFRGFEVSRFQDARIAWIGVA